MNASKAQPEIADLDKFTVSEKLAKIEEIFVLYPRLEAVIKEMESCREESKIANEAQSMLLVGDTGAGKTTAIKQYVKFHPREFTDDGDIIPVFSASIPSKATIKGVAENLLTKLNSPRPGAGNTVQLTHRLVTLLNNCKVELIILDEFQHLLQRAAEKTVDEIADWIKQLINESHIPIVLVGMPGSEVLLERNDQLHRRFAVVHSFEPFSYVDDPMEFRKFLRTVDGGLPFHRTSGRIHLSDPACAMRIFLASSGSPARTMRLVREAAKYAIKNEMEYITDGVLSTVYEKFIKRQTKGQKNPWSMSHSDVKKAVFKNASK